MFLDCLYVRYKFIILSASVTYKNVNYIYLQTIVMIIGDLTYKLSHAIFITYSVVHCKMSLFC